MLTQKHCVPCEGDTKPFTEEKIQEYLPLVHDWNLVGNKITREFTFTNFAQALHFVNSVGKIAEEEGHHPDIHLHSYKKVLVTLYTHAIQGLSENDFIVAAKINAL